MHEIDERVDSLHRLIGERESQLPCRTAPAPANSGHAVLTGRAIRLAAVRVLLESERAGAPIHYRHWFELLRGAGYEVSGKRPDAVFLSQITRSPVVKATTRAGVYELDLEAPGRLSQSLEGLQRKLSGLAADAPSDKAELQERTARQEEIGLEVRRAQKALTEATESLGEASVRRPVKLAA